MIKVENLHKHFGKLEVLKGIDYEINEKEVVCVIGPSGSGKSTFLRCLNLLEEVTDGAIYIEGVKINDPKTNINDIRTEVGMVFQQFNLFPHMTVLDNIMMAPMQVRKLKKADAEKLALDLLDKVGLREKAHSFPQQLSGGQQQRVAIARALITQPALLLADEPTGNLDSQTATEVFELFREVNQKEQCAVLLVTHDPRLSATCDRTIKLVDGRIDSDTLSGV